MELCSWFLRFDQIEDEIEAMIDLLQEAGIHVLLVSYGYGCRSEDVEASENIPVATSLLGDFLDRSEESGVYRFGKADLEIRSEDGRIRFLLCHESDVHCSGEDAPLVRQVRERWARLYPNSYEREDEEGSWKLLSGSGNGDR